MTKLEHEKLEKALKEAVVSAKKATNEFKKAHNSNDETEKHIAELKAHQYRSYAEGIYQVLVIVGYKHEDMKTLRNALDI